MCCGGKPEESGVWSILPCPMRDDDRVTKVEFVSLMVQLAAADRDAFRKLREQGWTEVAEAGSTPGKSELPN
jgi:hypothetical protein